MRTFLKFAVLSTLALGLSVAAPVRAQDTPAADAKPAEAPRQNVDKNLPHPLVTLETAKGAIRIELYPEDAPKTVENFIKLARKGFYDGLVFHRVVPGFVIQGGDPKGDGSGGPGWTIPDEKNKTLRHLVGALAMAKTSQPNSAGSQFYIVITNPQPRLDAMGYTVFGQVLSGQDVAEKIAMGDRINKVTITEPEKKESGAGEAKQQ